MSAVLRGDRRTPSDEEAAALTAAAGTGGPTPLPPETLVLLARWARHLSLRHQLTPGLISETPSQRKILQQAVTIASTTLQLANRTFQIDYPSAASILLLCSAAGALPSQREIEDITELVGGVLLSQSQAAPEHGHAFQENSRTHQLVAVEALISGVAALLPAAAFQPDAACWLFTALLTAISALLRDFYSDSIAVCSCISSLCPAMRTATGALLSDHLRSPGTAFTAGQRCLEAIYGTLRSVLLMPIDWRGSSCSRRGGEMAAAMCAAGGMLEAIARVPGPPRPSLVPLLQGLTEILQCGARTMSGMESAQAAAVQAAAAITLSQCYQSCRLPGPSFLTVNCLVSALFRTFLDIEPLIQIAQASMSEAPVTVSGKLAQHAQHGQIQQATALTSTAAVHLSQIRPTMPELAQILDIINKAAENTHQLYRRYILDVWSQHAGGVDHHPMQQLLERQFTSTMELLAAAVAVTSPNRSMPAMHIVAVLSIAANLQFCRTATPFYPPLLKSALVALPTAGPVAASQLIACLPTYAELEARTPSHGNASVWLIDSLTAAKLQLLFTALIPCCGSVPADEAEGHLAPLAFLYLLHPHAGTADAAHRVLWALFSKDSRTAEQLTPYYVTRCLEGLGTVIGEEVEKNLSNTDSASNELSSFTLDRVTHATQDLSQGLSTAFAVLPAASAVPVLCVTRILGRCMELLAAGACWDCYVIALHGVAAQQLLTVHHALVGALCHEIGEFIRVCPSRLRGKVCEDVLAVVAGTEDYVRKPQVVAWYQRLSSSIV